MGKIIRQLGKIERGLHKREILVLAVQNVQGIVDSGKYDLLKVYVELKRYETYLKGLIQHLKTPALAKAAREGENSFKYNDAQVKITQRTKWDFSTDDQWSKLDQQIQRLTKERKGREKYLKANNVPQTIVDEETGEVKELFDLPKVIQQGLAIWL